MTVSANACPAAAASRRTVGWKRLITLAALVALPAGAVIIPTDLVARGPVVCLSRLLLGLECWGCGMTRAISAAMHGEIHQAIDYNWRVVVVLPLLGVIWARAVRDAWAGGD